MMTIIQEDMKFSGQMLSGIVTAGPQQLRTP